MCGPVPLSALFNCTEEQNCDQADGYKLPKTRVEEFSSEVLNSCGLKILQPYCEVTVLLMFSTSKRNNLEVKETVGNIGLRTSVVL